MLVRVKETKDEDAVVAFGEQNAFDQLAGRGRVEMVVELEEQRGRVLHRSAHQLGGGRVGLDQREHVVRSVGQRRKHARAGAGHRFAGIRLAVAVAVLPSTQLVRAAGHVAERVKAFAVGVIPVENRVAARGKSGLDAYARHR